MTSASSLRTDIHTKTNGAHTHTHWWPIQCRVPEHTYTLVTHPVLSASTHAHTHTHRWFRQICSRRGKSMVNRMGQTRKSVI